MLINLTYFKGDIKLPNLNSPAEIAAINEVIERTERDLLMQALGYRLFTLFIANPTSGRFNFITAGAEFTFSFNGKTVTRKWAGLVNAAAISPLAYLSYYNFVRERASSSTGIGEVLNLAENASPTIVLDKLVAAYNKHVALIGDAQPSQPLYPDTFDYENDEPSLYNYLLTNKATFPEWEFKPAGYVNSFGF